MSDTDPYAGPVVENARETAPEKEETPVETPVTAPDEPVVETSEVPEGSIKTVLEWVGDDKDRAQSALDAEKAGQERSTLISKLEEIID